jgi:hypothetical protein
VSFGFPVQFALVVAPAGLGPQGRFQTFFHKALAHAGHRGGMHLQRLRDGFIAPTGSRVTTIGLQKNAGMQSGASGCFTAANQL